MQQKNTAGRKKDFIVWNVASNGKDADKAKKSSKYHRQFQIDRMALTKKDTQNFTYLGPSEIAELSLTGDKSVTVSSFRWRFHDFNLKAKSRCVASKSYTKANLKTNTFSVTSLMAKPPARLIDTYKEFYKSKSAGTDAEDVAKAAIEQANVKNIFHSIYY